MASEWPDPEPGDVVDGRVEVVDHRDRRGSAEELGGVVLLGGLADPGAAPPGWPRRPPASTPVERGGHAGQERGGHRPVDEQGLGGVADARAAGSWR